MSGGTFSLDNFSPTAKTARDRAERSKDLLISSVIVQSNNAIFAAADNGKRTVTVEFPNSKMEDVKAAAKDLENRGFFVEEFSFGFFFWKTPALTIDW